MYNAMSNSARTLQTKGAGGDSTEAMVLKHLQERDDEINRFATDAKETIQGLKDRLQDLEQKSARRGAPAGYGGGDDAIVKMADAFTKSGQFEALKSGSPTTGRVTVENVAIKSLTNAGQGVAGSTSYSATAQRQPGLYNDPRRDLSLLDYLPSLPASSATFEYMQIKDYTNNATEQEEEGAQKAQTSIDAELETANIATVAHWTRASKQVLDDTPALGQQIGNLLNYGLLEKLESRLIAGPGGKGKIKGLIGYAVPHVVVGTLKPVDAIGQAVTAMKTSGWQARLIIMNPDDWFSISSERDADGQYVLGSPRDPAPPVLWGVPVITSGSMPAGTVLLLDTTQVAMLDREQPTLMLSREDGNNFTSNLVTLLAELRAGLAVFSTGAVRSVDISDATGG
ncbi:phage major capsid protein [Pseudomonas putida]|uniref:phage major capsid protein n=1 Tax=Pseudomonas putida TaxID=303 RepID=UPI001628E5C8|nr:phage major capsid protein [Pseudomonas putida]QNG07213.1 phage major capsid protein [Pseudomonas putida]HDS1059578.1 phage major capsid protein [Pseudomonas putida]